MHLPGMREKKHRSSQRLLLCTTFFDLYSNVSICIKNVLKIYSRIIAYACLQKLPSFFRNVKKGYFSGNSSILL